MNILSVNEIKKYGVLAIEKKLKKGPVHVLKYSRPLFVILREEDYQSLQHRPSPASGLLTMISKLATGKRTRRSIDKQIRQEKDRWDY